MVLGGGPLPAVGPMPTLPEAVPAALAEDASAMAPSSRVLDGESNEAPAYGLLHRVFAPAADRASSGRGARGRGGSWYTHTHAAWGWQRASRRALPR
jgi:hypothetical protein